jgi:hypothetical protein
MANVLELRLAPDKPSSEAAARNTDIVAIHLFIAVTAACPLSALVELEEPTRHRSKSVAI